MTKRYSFSKRSLDNLKGVHPDLVRVAKRAIEITDQDFMIYEGVRTLQRQQELYGHSRTPAQMIAKGLDPKLAKPKESWKTNAYTLRNSKHPIQPSGYGHAFDFVPFPVDWNDHAKFKKVASALKQAATELNVKIVWGGDWSGKAFDAVHVEIA